MIGYLNGNIIDKDPQSIILSVAGVGYRVGLNTSCLENLEGKTETELWIYTNVKENELSLFGFPNKTQLKMFEILIGVSGVGPKTALEILNVKVEDLVLAISSGDTTMLTQVKGIGAKAADRIILDAKNKVQSLDVQVVTSSDNLSHNEILSETIVSLENLGFKRFEIVKKIRNAPKTQTTEELIKWFLAEQG